MSSTVEEFRTLRGIRNADWKSRASLAVGHAAHAPVFWASDGSTATLMIGEDDETWDIAIVIPR